jgi:hypothetical protein
MQHETLISVAPKHSLLGGCKDLVVLLRKFYIHVFCINLCMFQLPVLQLALPSQRNHARTIITTNHCRPHIASLYLPKSLGLKAEMKVRM